MSRQASRRHDPLNVEEIVEAAHRLIADDGLGALSMRRLGAVLGVDPMAVYHHVANKRELLSMVMARVVAAMVVPGDDEPWDVRVRGWATAYWDVVVANRELVLAGLADPVIAAGGIPRLAPLTDAIAASRIDADLVEPNAWLVVDFVHGSALGAAAPLRHTTDDLDPVKRAFRAGLDTILVGIAAGAGRSDRCP